MRRLRGADRRSDVLFQEAQRPDRIDTVITRDLTGHCWAAAPSECLEAGLMQSIRLIWSRGQLGSVASPEHG